MVGTTGGQRVEISSTGEVVHQRLEGDDRIRLLVDELGVTACNPNGPELQSPLFRDHIIGIYHHSQDHIPALGRFW